MVFSGAGSLGELLPFLPFYIFTGIHLYYCTLIMGKNYPKSAFKFRGSYSFFCLFLPIIIH